MIYIQHAKYSLREVMRPASERSDDVATVSNQHYLHEVMYYDMYLQR